METTETLSAATRQALEEAVRKAAPNNRLNCAAAMALANKFSVPPRLVGETADRLSIKISKCQLGCF